MMKQLAMFSCALIVVPVFADNGPGAPLRARLTGYHEVPAVSSPADGEFMARVSNDGVSVDYTLAYTGLSSTVAQAHIHFAQKAVNGPIVVWLCGSATNPGPAGTPVCPQEGSVSGTFTSANVLAAAPAQQLAAGELAELIAAMRNRAAYVNVHTANSPSGEIRGQVGARGR
jgi:hypothetical protein